MHICCLEENKKINYYDAFLIYCGVLCMYVSYFKKHKTTKKNKNVKFQS